MIDRLWRRVPWWMAVGIAALALFDLQFSVAGKALTLVAVAIGLAGVLTAPLADALLLVVTWSAPINGIPLTAPFCEQQFRCDHITPVVRAMSRRI